MTDKLIIRIYLESVCVAHASGASGPETSYYPALANLFNAIGATVKPKVRRVMNLRNMGNGMPDGGRFTADQTDRRGAEAAVASGQLPARGAIEAKGTGQDIVELARSAQVSGYLRTYDIVVVTNLREFAVVDRTGIRERFSLADEATSFWLKVAARPVGSAENDGEFFAPCLPPRPAAHDAQRSCPVRPQRPSAGQKKKGSPTCSSGSCCNTKVPRSI